MKDEIHDCLDEGLQPPPAGQPADPPGEPDPFTEELRAWDRLLSSFRKELPAVPTPPWLEDRVMAEITALPQPGLLRSLGSWFLTPRSVRVSPLLVGLSAAAMASILLLGRGPGPASGESGPSVVYVQFDLEDLDGDGTWTGRVPLKPGVHAYMFLVDGTEWMTDPEAQRYAEDGFGNRNAILAVAGPSA